MDLDADFNTVIKVSQRFANRAYSSLLYVERSKKPRSMSATIFDRNGSLESEFKKDLENCVSHQTPIVYLGLVQCITLYMETGRKILWVRVKANYVYRREIRTYDLLDLSTVHIGNAGKGHIDNKTTCLVYFPARGTQGMYCNVIMKNYTRVECITQYGKYFENRDIGVGEMSSVQYPNGEIDIYIVHMSQDPGNYDVMIISKPLMYQKRWN